MFARLTLGLGNNLAVKLTSDSRVGKVPVRPSSGEVGKKASGPETISELPSAPSCMNERLPLTFYRNNRIVPIVFL